METALGFDFEDDLDVPGELPEEIYVETDEIALGEDAGADFGLSVESSDEPGEAVKLQKGMAEPALLCYLALHTGEDGWYRQEEGGNRSSGSIFVKLSSDTGVDESKVRTIVGGWMETDLVETEHYHSTKRSAVTGLRLTGLGIETFAELLATRLEDVEEIEDFFIEDRYRTARMIRHEINHEREILGEEPQVFEDLSVFPGVWELNAHLAWLTQTQSRLESRVEQEEARRRIGSAKEKVQ